MTKKNRAVEFYRFAAAILILCYHFHWAAFPDGTLFSGCYLFVELFFILSGYLMLGYVRRHATEADRQEPAKAAFAYIRERLRRLYPQHLLSWALVAAIGLFLTKKVWPIQLLSIGWQELLLVNIFGFLRGDYINIVCWYLSALLFASYILYFLLLKCEDTFLRVIAPVLLVVCYGTIFDRAESLAVTIHFTRYAPNLGFMRALADITVGCLAYRAGEWLGDAELPGETVLATVVEAAVLLAAGFYMLRASGQFDFLFVPLFFAFTVSVFRGKSVFSRLLDNPVSAWLGKRSYAIFLNNFVVIYPFLHFFPAAGMGTMCLVCIPACCLVSLGTEALLRR